jgi:hypothetical protein
LKVRAERLRRESSLTLNELEEDTLFYKWKVVSWTTVISEILHMTENGNLNEDFTVVDICCGNAFLLHMIKNRFPKCTALGIDLHPFNSWGEIASRHDDIALMQVDVEDFVKVSPPFKFDLGFTFNTLRGWTKNNLWDISFDNNTMTAVDPDSKDNFDPRESIKNWLNINCKHSFSNDAEGEI